MNQRNKPTNCANCGAFIPNPTLRSFSGTVFCRRDCKAAYYKRRPLRSCLNLVFGCVFTVGAIAAVVVDQREKSDADPAEGSLVQEAPVTAGAALPDRPAPVDGTWTNREGKTITATLLRVQGDQAVLLKDGTEFFYPIGNLSDEDQSKIRAFVEASGDGSR